MPHGDRPTVAVIGGGFSGLLTAVHLLAQPDGPRVRLIERRPFFARGAAYSTTNPDHLLNVRASNMSAFPDQPAHFMEWLTAQGNEDARHAFVTRDQYGAYLQAILRQAAGDAAAGRLLLDADAAVAVRREGAGWSVTLAMGHKIAADAVVLAIGNLPPHTPTPISPEAAASPHYLADPWGIDTAALPQEGLAVILGAGLTMIDVALHLAQVRPRLKVLALSRRGLLPRRHLLAGPAPHSQDMPVDGSVRGLLKTLRAASRIHDWRAVVDGIRPHVQTIWARWSIEERRRFLRHARPWWDVHRHRLAPPVAAKLDRLIGSGALTVAAGAVRAVHPGQEGLKIDWSPRGRRTVQQLTAEVVINCTGPNGDLMNARDPLLSALAKDRLIRADQGRLGLDVDPTCRLIAGNGIGHETLFGVGPITRGVFWEITSVPDIRVQAAACAKRVAKAVQRADA